MLRNLKYPSFPDPGQGVKGVRISFFINFILISFFKKHFRIKLEIENNILISEIIFKLQEKQMKYTYISTK